MSEKQMSLPEHAEPPVYEYFPNGEEAPPWQICDWRALCAAFDLKKHEVLRWHEALAGQGRPWLVIRRIFHVAPLYGPESGVDDMRKWTFEELSKAQGVSESRLKQDLAAAIDYWKKERLANSFRGKAAQAAAKTDEAPSDEEVQQALKRMDGLPDFRIHQDLDADTVFEILAPLRFDHYRDASDRLYIANRCLELQEFLRDKHRREPARQLIGLEITMGAYELTQATLKQRLITLRSVSDVKEGTGDEAARLAAALEKNETALANLAKRHGDLAHKLGADEIETADRKRESLETIGYLCEAHRRYYEKGERDLIDGVFTADELVWLTTPLTIRPAQYRPDVVIRAREALLPENLWHGDYKPTTIQREACRRLLKLVEGLEEEVEPDKIEAIDADVPDRSEPQEELAENPQVPVSAAVPLPQVQMPAPTDEDVMAIG